ncbi:MAG: DUF1643 domain-containing protein, partial [Calditrichaeota bacterium]|nr:DUF1643 domain-containing protein [Calditrichota bacterium]
INYYRELCNLHVAIWGNHGVYQHRDRYIRQHFPDLYCMAINKSGQPKHPLYVRAGILYQRYR